MATNKATEIRKLLLDLGTTQAQIARELGIHIATVNGAIHGRSKSQRVISYIDDLRQRRDEAKKRRSPKKVA